MATSKWGGSILHSAGSDCGGLGEFHRPLVLRGLFFHAEVVRVQLRDSRHLVYSNNGHLHLLDVVTRQSLPIETGVGGAGEPTVSR